MNTNVTIEQISDLSTEVTPLTPISIENLAQILADPRVVFINAEDSAYFVLKLDDEDYRAVVCATFVDSNSDSKPLSHELLSAYAYKTYAQAMRDLMRQYCDDCGADVDHPMFGV